MKVNIKNKININNVNKAIQNSIKKNIYLVGVKIGDDSQTIPPKPPILTGDLRGSMNIEVIKENNKIYSRVSYNTVYAQRWHENPFTPHKDTEAGMKWLESKINRFNGRYAQLFQRLMRNDF